MSVDRLKYRELPSDTTLKNCSATSAALLAKLHTLTTASLMPSARRLVRHCSKSHCVLYGEGRHDGGMNLEKLCVRRHVPAAAQHGENDADTCEHSRSQQPLENLVRNQHALQFGEVEESASRVLV